MYFLRWAGGSGPCMYFFRGRGRVCVYFFLAGPAGWGPCMYFFFAAGAVLVFLFGGRRRVSIFISQIRPARTVLVFFYVLK